MGIYKRKDKNGKPYGPWVIQYPYRRDSVSGKAVHTTRTVGGSKRAAQRLHAKMMLEWQTRKATGREDTPRMTLAQLLDWYLDLAEVKAKRSYGGEQTKVALLKRHLGEHWADDLSAQRVTAWRSRMAQTNSRIGQPYAPSVQ